MITIRRASDADFDRIWPMLRDVFRRGDTYAVDPQITSDEARDYWMHAPDATFVAEEEGQLLGTYYLRRNQPGGGSHICNCGYIVDPQARGRGVAAAMCTHSQQQAVEAGYRAMQFNFVLASNDGALRLWEKLGFAIIGTIPQAFAHPTFGYVDAHILYKSLIERDRETMEPTGL